MAPSGTDPQQVKQAVDALFGYTLPFVQRFVRRQPPPRISSSLTEKFLRQEIEHALLGLHEKVHLDLDRLRLYLDELQESGNQHIFALELPRKACDDLVRRFDPSRIPAGPADRWIPEARDGPKLAEIRYDPGGAPVLILKWVETRPFTVHLGWEVDPDTGVQTAQKVQREERAVNYFRLDLAAGQGELKIQKLQTNALAARRTEFAKYRALVAEVTGCDGFVKLTLAPAIRRALEERTVDFTSVTVVLPHGGEWTGRKSDRCPVDPAEIKAAISLNYTLPSTSVRVDLDGQLDEIQVPKPCTPDQLESILAQVRRWYLDSLTGAPLPQPPIDPDPAASPPPPPSPSREERLLQRILRLLKESLPTHEGPPGPGRDELGSAVREFVASHPPEDEGGPAGEPDYSRSAIEQFLRYIARVASREQQIYLHEVERLHKDERVLFWLFVAAAAAALAIVAAGAVLTFASPGRIAIGTLVQLVGLVTGGGSLLIRNGHQRIDERLDRLGAREDEFRRVLDAIQAALAVPDPVQRSEEMRQVAAKLRNRL